jgi:hypothetical protein
MVALFARTVATVMLIGLVGSQDVCWTGRATRELRTWASSTESEERVWSGTMYRTRTHAMLAHRVCILRTRLRCECLAHVLFERI